MVGGMILLEMIANSKVSNKREVRKRKKIYYLILSSV